jgi:hypothetical protein
VATYVFKPSFGSVAIRTLLAAVAAVVVNNIYSVAYTALTGFALPEVINPVSVSLFSAAPVIIGGLVYYIASRFSVPVAQWGLIIGTIIVFVMFAFPSFADTIQTPGSPAMPAPEGFAGLSFGLHFAGPIFLLWLVPRSRS